MKVVCRDGDEDDDGDGDEDDQYDVDRDEEAPVFRFLRAKPKMEDTRLWSLHRRSPENDFDDHQNYDYDHQNNYADYQNYD